jgi:hypothetical protein
MARKDERSTLLRQASRAAGGEDFSCCLSSTSTVRESIHQRSCGNGSDSTDDCWQTVFAIGEGNAGHAHQHYHWQRSEDYDASAIQWNSEYAAQCRFGFPKLNQRSELQEKRSRIEKHIGND